MLTVGRKLDFALVRMTSFIPLSLARLNQSCLKLKKNDKARIRFERHVIFSLADLVSISRATLK